MTSDEFERHLDRWCGRCRYFKSGRCPEVVILRRDPDDPAVNRMFRRLGRCCQFEEIG